MKYFRHGIFAIYGMQGYETKYEEQKSIYKDKVDEFLAGLGGQEEQDAYLNSLADYKAKRRVYLKHFRLKKLDLVKVHAHVWYERERKYIFNCTDYGA